MADLLDRLRSELAQRYTIERELGRGGMARVFLAHDLRHDRPVALKLLHPELAATMGPERFQREIKLAARLQHPHILTVLDSGEAGGQLWFTMPFVEGESLRDRLRREHQLALEDAIRIAREAALGLECAHQHGVIHRDVKPENLLLTRDGSTLVADFGIARALSAGDAQLTETGMAVGTPAYMSPEQASGARDLDARTDVYSLGCVLYEMLAGEPPFGGPTPQVMIARRFTETPHPLHTLRETVPESLDHVVQKALARIPADRFATAAQFAQALGTPTPATTPAAVVPPAPRARKRRWVPVGVTTLAVGFLLGLGVLFAWLRTHPGEEAAGGRRLAVLPFDNLGDSTDNYFADGVTDAVRGKLTALPGLQVIASNSSSQYRHTTKTPQQIGRELGVDYLLVGKVRWAKAGGASRVEVSPELIQVATATAKWEEPFDASLTDVFAVQADIAGRVAQALGVALGGSERTALTAAPTRSVPAYDALLRGDRIIITEGKVDLPSVRQAEAAYREAVQLDSGSALAWARLARAEALRYSGGDRADSVARMARVAADRALTLAPDRVESHFAIAYIRGLVESDNRGAIDALEHARTLSPHDVDVLSLLAAYLSNAGRNEEGVRYYADAARIDPRSVVLARRYAQILLNLRRLATAESVAVAGLRLAPDNLVLIDALASARFARGDLQGAHAVLHDALGRVGSRRMVRELVNWIWLMDDSVRTLALRLPAQFYDDDRARGFLSLAQIRWNEGHYERARAYADSARSMLEVELEQRPGDPALHWTAGWIYALLGNRAEAMRQAGQARVLYKWEPGTSDWTTWLGNLGAIELFSGNLAAAVALVDSQLHLPGGPTAAGLRIDPFYAPLRGRADFQRLLTGK